MATRYAPTDQKIGMVAGRAGQLLQDNGDGSWSADLPEEVMDSVLASVVLRDPTTGQSVMPAFKPYPYTTVALQSNTVLQSNTALGPNGVG